MTEQSAIEILDKVRESMGDRAERRLGQEDMARAVAKSIQDGSTLLVQAGTGTGKSLAYLSAALADGASVLIATATKSLQDQLAAKDLPQIERALGHPLDFATIKGRSNYVCLAKLDQARKKPDARDDPAFVADVELWTETPTASGERSDLPFPVTDRQWEQVSVGVNECPGASHCPFGEQCYAERAIEAATQAQIAVCNTHLLLLDRAQPSGPRLDKDVIVIDEAHELPDIATHMLSTQISVGGLKRLASRLGKLAAEGTGHRGIVTLLARADELAMALESHKNRVIRPEQTRPMLDGVRRALTSLRELTQRGMAYEGSTGALANGLDRAIGSRVDAIDVANGPPDGWCAWVDSSPQLLVSPIEPGRELSDLLYSGSTILCSATLRTGPDFKDYARRVGTYSYEDLDVGSPFDYEQQAALYCDPRMPRPSADNTQRVIQEYRQRVEPLLEASGGSALLLFTSWRMLNQMSEELEDFITHKLGVPFFVQGRDDKSRLIQQFVEHEGSVLAGTAGFWQGLDAQGDTCRLVVVDKLPFAAPDPLIQARRQAVSKRGGNPFMEIDLPRAAISLAQGVGRLIRSGSDHGLVAVMDPRLAKSNYSEYLRSTLPPMRRLDNVRDAVQWLRRA